MYVTQRPNDVIALDAKTGRVFWLYRYTPSPDARVCCGANNRGVAILGDTLFMGTLDAHLDRDRREERPAAVEHRVADVKLGYSITHGAARRQGQGDRRRRRRRVRHPRLHRRLRREDRQGSVALLHDSRPGRAGHETWSGDAGRHGGGSVWVTGSYDPGAEPHLLGHRQSRTRLEPDQRPGDNLYTDSVVALDADTGKLKWHFQFTPNDGYDYDSVQVPVLADINWQGTPRKAMLWANRNGFFYVLDRVTGKFLLGKPFVKVNWASGLDERPADPDAAAAGQPTWPGNQGGTNWYPPSFSPRTGLFYFSAWENYATIYRRGGVVSTAGPQLRRRRLHVL
jgi:alcohol dehydrogenase (cytochrome c)